MKIYIMSKTINGDMKAPRASTDKEALAAEMNRQHDEVLKKAGHLAMDIGQLENGHLTLQILVCIGIILTMAFMTPFMVSAFAATRINRYNKEHHR